jgi:hypothetical protein
MFQCEPQQPIWALGERHGMTVNTADHYQTRSGFVSGFKDVGLAWVFLAFTGRLCYNPVMFTPEEKRLRQIEATRRWRIRNPEKVKANNRKHRQRPYEAEKVKAWREKRLADPAYRERINRQANKRATSIRRWLDAYKIENGCIDCGFNRHPVALHFDHVNGDKALNVCNAKSIKQAQQEIAKCVVRCANCHAMKTWKNHIGEPSSFS